MVRDIPITEIKRRSDARPLNDGAINALADSIKEIGVINPLRIREIGDGWEVVAGSHRLAACEKLGLDSAPCIVVTDSDLHAELAMIDENLCRAELSASDRAQQTFRRKAIYEELHPETKAYVAGALGSNAKQGNATDKLSAASFASSTAAAVGKDERSVRRDAERGEKVLAEVHDLIRGTHLDTGTYLDKLKKMPGSEQFVAAKRDLAVRKVPAKKSSNAPKVHPKVEADVKFTALATAADIIAEHVPEHHRSGLLSNLYAAGLGKLADILTNEFSSQDKTEAA